jgi:hypothetical protein
VTTDGDYATIADAQLDALEAGPAAALYNAVLDPCELVLAYPLIAQARSTAVTTRQGIRLQRVTAIPRLGDVSSLLVRVV